MLLNASFLPDSQRRRDFIVLAPPRSGSNMLASALNSHRHIACFGDFFVGDAFTWLGGDVTEGILHGELIHHIEHVRKEQVAADSIIVLVRSSQDIIESRKALFNRRLSHQLSEGYESVPAFRFGCPNQWLTHTKETVDGEQADLRAYAEPRGALFVRYETLIDGTGGALNVFESNRICDYLGVGREPLTPLTQKLPKVRV